MSRCITLRWSIYNNQAHLLLGYAIDASPEQSQCLITRLAYVFSPILLLGWLHNTEVLEPTSVHSSAYI